MLKLKKNIFNYFDKLTYLSIICYSDILIIILLSVVLLNYSKSKQSLNKIYHKINKNKKICDIEKLDIENPDNEKKMNNDFLIEKKSPEINDFKNNIKLIYKKKDELDNKNPYKNDKESLHKKYTVKPNDTSFKIHVNSTICSTPIFNLRSFKDLNFHYNFLIHNFCPKKINNLIMCKDIHQWMTTSSLSNEDLEDELVPVYFIKKKNDSTDVFEYLKLFIHTDKNGLKAAFVQKGNDYLHVKDDIDELISKSLIKDLLEDKNYNNYNLSIHESVCNFLDKFLSLVLISEEFIGDNFELDIKNYYENNNTYEYFFNTLNSEVSVFSTTI